MPEKKYAIVGMSVVPGPHPGRSPRAVQAESCWQAIEDAGLTRDDIDGAIEVANEARPWIEGRCILFDNSFLHRVWNRGSSPRVVLSLSIMHPDLTAVEREIIKFTRDKLGGASSRR